MSKPRFIKPPKEILKDLFEPEFSWFQTFFLLFFYDLMDNGQFLWGLVILMPGLLVGFIVQDRLRANNKKGESDESAG